MAAGLTVLIHRYRPREHPARVTASAAMLFMVMDALIGAGLVLLGLVGQNASAVRAISTALHLANTSLLIGALGLRPRFGSRLDPTVSSRNGYLVFLGSSLSE